MASTKSKKKSSSATRKRYAKVQDVKIKRYRRSKNPFKKKKGGYHSYKICEPHFDLEEFRRNRRYLSKPVIATPTFNISKSSVQVNVNCSSPSSYTGIESSEKSSNVAVGRKDKDDESSDEETVTDLEFDSDSSSSTESLYEESSDSEEDSSDDEKQRKKPRRLVLEEKNGEGKESDDDNDSSYSNPELHDITHRKNGVRKSRVRWGIGKAYFVMEKAINEWNEKKGRALDDNNNPVLLNNFCKHVSIPYKSFSKYVKKSGTKTDNRVLGSIPGRSMILSTTDQLYIAEVLARKDRANDGLDISEAIDLVMELNENVTRKQAHQHIKRCLMPNYAHIIKPRVVAAQKTTTSRTQITLVQQFRWHETVTRAYNELKKRNKGTCNLTGKPFEEVLHMFIVGGDETCFMACPDGTIKVVGCSTKSKHEKRSNDSRASITMYRTGCVNGDTGPTMFLLKGKCKRKHYTDEFLKQYGAKPGSTVIMTPSAFMTIEAWEQMTPKLVKGLCNINPVVAATLKCI